VLFATKGIKLLGEHQIGKGETKEKSAVIAALFN
jgi:hypothetical protein